jgi:hypothetical protein
MEVITFYKRILRYENLQSFFTEKDCPQIIHESIILILLCYIIYDSLCCRILF